ncbi:MAG: 30S ribosomal protein S1 [Sedimentisphaerales bacterium]|nr:30S ribosomal protein S1 [Sedimentisphaerales bacterium]
MVDKSIFLNFDIDESAIDEQIAGALGVTAQDDMLSMIDKSVQDFEPGAILKGKIVNHIGDDVIIEVGLKSEGAVSQSEFDDPSEIHIGDEIEVLLESVESDSGLVMLSKRKADRIRGWERIIANCNEGDVIKGKVTRRIKGGLLVDVGVPVFLPASQVDVRRPGDVSEYIGREIKAKILKIDEERRNIVISRRKLLEETRASAKANLLDDIQVGDIRKGTVKNIADFGAFVDLGGLDGLLHITDMSWGRVGHPSEVVQLDQEIEVKILSIDREKEKVALGLKQRTESPWATVKERYPVNGVVKGHVVNIMSYGAFIKLEDGVEGLVHISEMSWTKRINHPGDILSVGEEIEVAVLDVNPAKQEISLGIKQLQENPWTQVAQKYPPGTIVEGRIRNLANYGAFIEIEEGIDGLLHVSDMSWTKKISHPGDMLKKGDTIKCVVLDVNREKQRVALGLKQMTEDPWLRAIPEKYIAGQIVHGTVTKLTNFGVFVELEPELEGLLHISELSDQKVDGPQDVVNVGDDLEVKILRVDLEDRKIGLSLKRAQWAAEDDVAEAARPVQRGGLEGAAGMGTNLIDSSSVFNTAAQQAQAAPDTTAENTEASDADNATEESDISDAIDSVEADTGTDAESGADSDDTTKD